MRRASQQRRFERAPFAQKIRGQNLDRRLRSVKSTTKATAWFLANSFARGARNQHSHDQAGKPISSGDGWALAIRDCPKRDRGQQSFQPVPTLDLPLTDRLM